MALAKPAVPLFQAPQGKLAWRTSHGVQGLLRQRAQPFSAWASLPVAGGVLALASSSRRHSFRGLAQQPKGFRIRTIATAAKEPPPNVIDVEEVRKKPNHPFDYDVIIVGAGACGVGVGLMLTRVFGLELHRIIILERGSIGESFKRWPKEMRFISPSFNQQGWTKSFDLNSVFYGTSPSYTLRSEHPTGEEYAEYLEILAEEAQLPVWAEREVKAVRPLEYGGFEVDVLAKGSVETLDSRYVVWAGGEYQYPRTGAKLFTGAEHCLHNSAVQSWAELPGDDFVIVGGFESGMDAATSLARCGKRATVLSSTPYWRVSTTDPSTELAPYTAQRVRDALMSDVPPQLLAPYRVLKVEEDEDGSFLVHARREEEEEVPADEREKRLEGGVDDAAIVLRTPHRPLLCVGFEGSARLGVVKDLFAFPETGGPSPLITRQDESTLTPGLFLVGPSVRQAGYSFCFVYKYRQRFGIVAQAIAAGLGLETEAAVADARRMEMFMDDLACCEDTCGEGC